MTWQLVVAGALAAVAVALHGTFGERVVVPALRDANVAPATQLIVWVVWHIVTVTFLVTAVWLAGAGFGLLARDGAHVVTGLYAVLALFVFAAVARYDARALLRAPQWALFVAIAALASWAAP